MLSGNRGEWSEVYVFLKLLGEGRLYAADQHLNRLAEVFFPIIRVLREEEGGLDYFTNGKIVVRSASTGEVVAEFTKQEFLEAAQVLLSQLRNAKGRAFSLPAMEKMLADYRLRTLKANSSSKADIIIVVHDLRTGLEPKLGFSIKSLLGKNATLFNASQQTNFVFEAVGQDPKQLDVRKGNLEIGQESIASRIQYLRELGFHLEFVTIEGSNLYKNLQLIDSGLPQIIAQMLVYKYSGDAKPRLVPLLSRLAEENPLKFDLSGGHPFYEYKVKRFLVDAALGMKSTEVWKGEFDATGGIIVVRENGDVVCYHIYNHNEFESYLLNNTKLEEPDRGRNQFGFLYQDRDRIFIKLNLQVRFT